MPHDDPDPPLAEVPPPEGDSGLTVSPWVVLAVIVGLTLFAIAVVMMFG